MALMCIQSEEPLFSKNEKRCEPYIQKEKEKNHRGGYIFKEEEEEKTSQHEYFYE